jgi:uncharacterized OB-fold protein
MPDDATPANPARILPKRNRHNAAFWEGGASGRLMITRCTQCALWVHPPAADCPDCGGPLTAQPVSGEGNVFTFTVNHQPFNPAVPLPYVIAIIELVEQTDLRIAANIVDCEPDSIYIGMPVEVRFEAQSGDDTVHVPVFAPRAGVQA